MAERCEICGTGWSDDPLPCYLCWDHRASEADVDLWVATALAKRGTGNSVGDARHLLSEIGDPAAAPALRRHIDEGNPRLLPGLINSLGWSGDRQSLR